MVAPQSPQPDPGEDPITLLLGKVQEGDEAAEQELLPLVYSELYRLAKGQMRDQPQNHTLGATGLVNEAYLRLLGGAGGGWESRRHFLRVAAKAMRSALVDHARRKRSDKRGGKETFTPFDEICAEYEERSLDLLALDEALENLAKKDEELARIVDLKFFAGLENARIAEVLDCSTRTIERGWKTARSWLNLALTDSGELE